MGKFIDLIGQRFGRLVVVKIDHKDKRENGNGSVVYWQCLCDCGNTKVIRGSDLKSMLVKSCGCLLSEDLIGRKFGRLTVIGKTGKKQFGNNVWSCLCDCGNIVDVGTGNLKSGNTKSCGCLGKCNGQHITAIVKEYGHTNPILLKCNISINNTSGTKGVCWDKTRNKWVAQINIRKKAIRLGRFDDINDAIAARKAAEEKYFKPVLEEYENQKKEVSNE